ncbi:17610_t:CDS:2, partial [Racocetra fulgida]
EELETFFSDESKMNTEDDLAIYLAKSAKNITQEIKELDYNIDQKVTPKQKEDA